MPLLSPQNQTISAMHRARLLFSTFKIIRSQKMHGTRMLCSIDEGILEIIGSVDAFLFVNGFRGYYRPYCKQLILDIASLSPPMSHACRTFNLLHNTDIYTWNTMIRRYAQSGKPASDSDIHHQPCVNFIKPNTYTHEYLPKALENLVLAREVEKGHCIAIKYGVDSLDFVENALVRFYGACGHAHSAYEVLKLMPETNLVGWNSVLIGHVLKREYERTLTLYLVILLDGLKPDEFTLVSELAACAQLGRIGTVRRVHGYMFKVGLDRNLHAADAILYYYAKCGFHRTAEELFVQLEERNAVSWTSMIVGMSVNGASDRTLELFEEFERQGLVPKEITFAGVLFACSHSSLVGKALVYFERMTKEFGIEPIIEHYACTVYLFCRSAMPIRAYKFIKEMPLTPDATIWRMVHATCPARHREIKETAKVELVKLGFQP